MKNRNDRADSKLPREFNLSKMPMKSQIHYDLDQSTDWVATLLSELNDKASDLSETQKLAQTELKIELDLEKRFKGEVGEYLLAEITLTGQFLTECVNTLQTMKDMIHHQFKACFIQAKFETDELYSDQTEIFMDGEVYELYFYQRNLIDIFPPIHEQLFLNINPYPKIETEEIKQ